MVIQPVDSLMKVFCIIMASVGLRPSFHPCLKTCASEPSILITHVHYLIIVTALQPLILVIQLIPVVRITNLVHLIHEATNLPVKFVPSDLVPEHLSCEPAS